MPHQRSGLYLLRESSSEEDDYNAFDTDIDVPKNVLRLELVTSTNGVCTCFF